MTFDEEWGVPTEFIDDWGNERGSFIDPADIDSHVSPEQRRLFHRLAKTQKGIDNKGRRTKDSNRQHRRRKKEELLHTVTSQLELAPHQKEQAKVIFMSLDLQRLGLPMELVAFCLCVLVARQDGRMYHPNRSKANNDEQFRKFAQSLSEKEQSLIVKTLNRLQHRLSDKLNW